MRVYKFLSSNWALEALRTNRIKIGLLSEFNDPWEGRAVRFAHGGQKEAWEVMLRGLSLKLGAICFSKSWFNPVLWSHYADRHKGVVLGFDVIDHTENGQTLAYEVDYVEDRPQFDMTPGRDLREALEQLQKLLSIKFKHWEYEDEVRYFVGLADADEKTGHFFAGIGTEIRLKEVIFGARCDSIPQIVEIISRAKKHSGVEISRVTFSDDDFRMIADRSWIFLE